MKKIKKLVKVTLILLAVFILSKQIWLFNYSNKSIPSINNTNPEYDIYDMSQYHTYEDVSILQYEEGTVLERLEAFNKYDNKFQSIIDNYNDYPDKLLETLSRNPELIDFVIDYPSKKNKVYSDNIGTFQGVPELYQWDERWGYADLIGSSIAVSGCGPTALSMVIAYFKCDNTITPYKVAKMGKEKGWYIKNVGTTWDLIRNGAKEYGLTVNELPLSKEIIYNSLEKGHLIICNVRKGDFTINGHYIVIAGIEDGKLKINDPFSKIRSHMLWNYDRLKSQIRNLWELYI